MATQQEMEATYNYMDEIFRLSLGATRNFRECLLHALR